MKKATSNNVILTAQAIVNKADALVKTREDWQQNEYARSNTRLYEILADVLRMYEQVKDDKQLRAETVKQMKQQLQANGVRVQMNTLAITLFVHNSNTATLASQHSSQPSFNNERNLPSAFGNRWSWHEHSKRVTHSPASVSKLSLVLMV